MNLYFFPEQCVPQQIFHETSGSEQCVPLVGKCSMKVKQGCSWLISARNGIFPSSKHSMSVYQGSTCIFALNSVFPYK